MEVDVEDVQAGVLPQTARLKKQINSPVDDVHPFDLESYISSYTGRTAVDRLIHIISTCPPIAPQAFSLAVQHIYQLRDPSLFPRAQAVYESLPAAFALPPASEIATLDTQWMEEISKKNAAEKTKLEVELKTYSNNMIKESIRMAHRDLGDFYRAVGDAASSLKHYTKSREYCASSQQVIEMCLSVIELMIEQRNYIHIPTYVFKAEAALEASTATAGKEPATTSGTSQTHLHKHRSEEREKVQAKLDFATALGHLGQGNYQKAAHAFMRLTSISKLGDWVGKLVSPGDIAIYGTLCALSSLSRNAIQSHLMGSTTFGVYIEHESYVRDLIEAYMASDFKTAFEIISRNFARHCADIHLAAHIHDLTDLIRNWAVVLYFQPFSSIRLERMGQAFGWTVDEVEQQVVGLIVSNQIHARVDSQNKILKAKDTDYRTDLFTRAIKAGEDMQSATRKLLLRMQLQQADLVVRSHANVPTEEVLHI